MNNKLHKVTKSKNKSEETLQKIDQYHWIIFDADETLFTFDSYRGLQTMFCRFGIDFSLEDFKQYQTKNRKLWEDYQQGLLTATDLQSLRFQSWAEKLGISPEQINHLFLQSMGDICVHLEGAKNLLDRLHGRVKMAIMTNGFRALQSVRLDRTQSQHYFDLVVTSEEVGVAKPHPKIFDHALSLMGEPDRKKVLMVGDTFETDILGGLNAGMDTCWLNWHGKEIKNQVKPHYEVCSLIHLEELLF